MRPPLRIISGTALSFRAVSNNRNNLLLNNCRRTHFEMSFLCRETLQVKIKRRKHNILPPPPSQTKKGPTKKSLKTHLQNKGRVGL